MSVREWRACIGFGGLLLAGLLGVGYTVFTRG